MANERYKKYLESRETLSPSSRYTQEVAQDRRLSTLEKAGIGAGILGLAVLGARTRTGQKAIAEVSSFLAKRTRPAMTRLERELSDSRYTRRRILKHALSEAGSTRGDRLISNFRSIGQDSIADQLEFIEKRTKKSFQSETATFFNKSVKSLQRGLEEVDLQGTGMSRDDFNKILSETIKNDRIRSRQIFQENTQRFNEALKDKYIKKRSISNLFGLRRMTVDDVLSGKVDHEFSDELIATLNLRDKPGIGERPQDAWLKNKLKNMVSKDPSMKNLSFGRGMYVNKQGEVVDLRFIGKAVDKTLDIAKNIQLPILQISPYRVLRMDEMRDRFGRTLTETIRPGSFQVPISTKASGFKTDRMFVRYGDKVVDAFDPLGESIKGNFYTVRGIRNPTSKMYTKMIDPEVATRGVSKEPGKLRQFFDLGSNDTPSIWVKIRAKFIKDDKVLRPQSYLSAYAEATSENSLEQAHQFYTSLLNSKTTAFSDDIFNLFSKDIDELYGRHIDLSTDDAVWDVFQRIATGNMSEGMVQSQVYKDQFSKLWYQYKSDPLDFKENRVDSVRKLIHKEFLDQLYTQRSIDPFEVLESSKISSISSKAKVDAESLIYNYTIDRMGTSSTFGQGPSLIRNMLFSSSKEAQEFRSIAKRVHSKMDPAFSFKGLAGYEYPDREVFNQSHRMLVRKTIMPWEDGVGFFRQFFAGRNSPEYVTEATSVMFNVGVRLNEMLGQFGLGLSNKSMGSSAQIFGNLFAKRLLPAVVAKEYLGYINWQFGKLTGYTFEEIGANISANAQMEFSRWSNQSGFSNFANRALDVMPGAEELLMMPIIESFDPTRSEQETWDRIHGEVPVRKGRWWTMGNCVTPDTPILINSFQSKMADQVKVGDLLLTHTGNKKPVKQVFIREMEDYEWTPSVEIYTFPIPTVTTDNHPYFIVKNIPCHRKQYKECRPDRHSYTCIEKCKKCLLPDIWNPEWVLARDVNAGDFIAFPRQKIQNKIESVHGIESSFDTGFFIGLFLAEGSIHKRYNNRAYSIAVSLNSSETNLVEFVSNFALKNFEANTSIRKTSENGIKIITCSRKLSKWVEDVFYQSGEKSIPSWIFDAGEEFVLGFLSGYFDGDGHYEHIVEQNTCRFNITSSKLENLIAVRNILFALGIENSIVKHDTNLNGNSFQGWRLIVTGSASIELAKKLKCYKISKEDIPESSNRVSKYTYFDQNYVYIKIKSINDSGYRGKVYDYEVDEDHSFCSLSVILHNTPFVGGRTEYFAPSSYRVAYARPLMTDVLYGSEEEYWENHWLPTPSSPLAPIRHYITDPYHYENKHYDDRPYPVTGGFSEINEIPVIGPIADKAISSVLKPQRYMHEDEWMVQQHPVSSGEYSGTDGITSVYIPPGASIPSSGSKIGKGFFPVVAQSGEIAGTDEFGRAYTNPVSTGSVAEQSWKQAKDVSGLYGFMLDSVLGEDQVSDYSNVIADSRAMTSQRRRFWDSDINGLDINPASPDLNEVARRAIGKNEKWGQRFNPIKNTMPSWMPGEEYFTDFRSGDPYVKVKKGEQRLPGAGYEALNDVPSARLQMRASQIGRDVQGMVNYFLKLDDDFSPWTESVLEDGTAIHKAIQNYWSKLGILHSAEVELYDSQFDVTGHYDAVIKKTNALGKEYLEMNDIKSMSDKRFKEAVKAGKPYQEHMEQVNYYMGISGIKKGSLFYVNRDDTSQVHWFNFNFDKKMFQESRRKLETARAITNELIYQGVVSPWETYDEFHRFKILADVAPYSEQYDYYAEKMQEDYWKEKYGDEIRKIKSQVSERKKPHRFYDRNFQNADLQYEQVTIKKQIDRNTYLTEEYPHNPIKLAGVSVNKNTKEVDDFLSQAFAPGTPITIGYTSDPLDKYSKDNLKTIRVVAYYGHHSGRYKDELFNINKQLVQKGYARELDSDYSPAGIHARFTDAELQVGKVWEFIAHQDTPINTKVLQVRSALESYKRRDLYGKDWQPWTIEGQVTPTVESLFAGHPVRSAIVGGALVAMMWRPNRLKAGIIGGAFAAAMSLIRAANEFAKEEKWIPERRIKEREIDEYFDRLTYIKYKGLYEAASRRIQEEEGYSVEAKIRYFENKRKDKSKEIKKLEEQKKQLRISQDIGLIDKFFNLFRKDDVTYKDKIREINEQIKNISEEKKSIPVGEEELSDLGKKAVEYRERFLSTLYAVDPYGPRSRIYKALPKKDRKYFDEFLDAAPEERKEILQLIPKNQRRIYQALWNMDRDEKEGMEEYFSKHYLPDSNWEGWLPDKSLDDIKIKVAKYENLDISEFGYWKTDELRSDANNAPLINIRDNNMRRSEIEKELRILLEGEGLEDIIFELTPAEYGVTVDIDLRKDKRKEIEEYLEANGLSSLF